jgi:hypothetical protein
MAAPWHGWTRPSATPLLYRRSLISRTLCLQPSLTAAEFLLGPEHTERHV